MIATLTEDEKLEALERPPGDRRSAPGSPRARPPSRARDADPEVLAELARLNREYEERFGFRFVVFVNRRPKAEILEVLRERIERTRERGAGHRRRGARRDRGGPMAPLLAATLC